MKSTKRIAAIIITEPGVIRLSALKGKYQDFGSVTGCIVEWRRRSRCLPVFRGHCGHKHTGLTFADLLKNII